MDFTLQKYIQLLGAINEQAVEVFPVADWIERNPAKGILMRHDVDRWPANALDMAQTEARFGIKSTYYFRVGRPTFKPKVMEAIANLGHEIGYHYEDLALANGDAEKAIVLFENHLNRFREIHPVKTIAMHGRPLSGHDSRHLWKVFNFHNFGITGEAFLSIDYSDIYYFTDTGRSWADGSINLRDRVSSQKNTQVHSTDDLIRFVAHNQPEKIAIVAHPERWNDSLAKWLMYGAFDNTVNVVKQILKISRSKK